MDYRRSDTIYDSAELDVFTHNSRRLAVSTVFQGTVAYLGITTNIYFEALSNHRELGAVLTLCVSFLLGE